MPPRLALFLGYGLIWWLFRNDRRWRKLSSPALWIPGLWLAILGSRPVSFWIGGGGSDSLEGSPINVLCNGALIGGAFWVLLQRNFDWGDFTRRNKALISIYVYFAVSVLWSAFP